MNFLRPFTEIATETEVWDFQHDYKEESNLSMEKCRRFETGKKANVKIKGKNHADILLIPHELSSMNIFPRNEKFHFKFLV